MQLNKRDLVKISCPFNVVVRPVLNPEDPNTRGSKIDFPIVCLVLETKIIGKYSSLPLVKLFLKNKIIYFYERWFNENLVTAEKLNK